MVPLILAFHRIRMHQGTQWPAINHQPRDKCPELCGCEQVDLEHGDRMRTNWAIEECVDAEFRDCSVSTKYTPSTGYRRDREYRIVHSRRIRSHKALAKTAWSGLFYHHMYQHLSLVPTNHKTNAPDNDRYGYRTPLLYPWIMDRGIPHMRYSGSHAVGCETTFHPRFSLCRCLSA